jgi:dTDP-4-amino-4,6-dideoxygalactose transaminase
MIVPFLDLNVQYESINGEINQAIQQVFDSSAFVGGLFVERFEQQWASFCGCRHAVGVASGTDALWLVLLALGIGQGDEVITVPNTFIATAEAISSCGATPVFVDIEENSFNMDPQKLKDFLEKSCIYAPSSRMIINKTTKRLVKAIIPVHLYGQPADMEPIMEIARANGLPVVEDASQAHGASYRKKPTGTIGDAGCFSFYPGKNLGAYGKAGAVVTDNPELAQKIRILRDHGQPGRYLHTMIGWNGMMDGIQGAVLSVKLEHLNKWNESRRKAAVLYNKKLSQIGGLKLPIESGQSRHVYNVYGVLAKNREHLMANLLKNNIHTRIHYPIPIHLQKAYQYLHYEKGSYPVAEKFAKQVLSLPIFPEMTETQIDHVAEGIKNWVDANQEAHLHLI